MMKVMLGAPVRNRAWILPRFIEHVKKLDLTDISLCTTFIINDCEDESAEILSDAGFTVVSADGLPTSTPGWDHGKYSYGHLAAVRNLLVEEFMKSDAEWLFSVDSDIILPKDCLTRLMSRRKMVCSALLGNQNKPVETRAYNIMELDSSRVVGDSSRGIYPVFRHFWDWPKGELVQVDLTGAVYLIHRQVFESGVRYSNKHPQGEDASFCWDVRGLGYQMFCDTSIRPIHVLAPGIETEGDLR